MRAEKLCSELENAVLRLGWKIRQERGNFHGGACLLSGERMIIINCRLTPEEKIEVFSQVLAESEIDAIYLVPEVRRFLEDRPLVKKEKSGPSERPSSEDLQKDA
jgi:hypothetical protein